MRQSAARVCAFEHTDIGFHPCTPMLGTPINPHDVFK